MCDAINETIPTSAPAPAPEPKAKPHRTVRITHKMLLDLRACRSGLSAAEPFLSARVSTDPDANLPLALRICDAVWAGFDGKGFDTNNYHRAADNVSWLIDEMNLHGEGTLFWSDGNGPNGPFERQYHGTDAGVIAQQLAMIADAILSKRGR